MTNKIIIIGSGNAAMCAGIAALERGASVVMYEKAEKILAGGNTKYTAGAMRFCFDGLDRLRDLLRILKMSDWKLLILVHTQKANSLQTSRILITVVLSARSRNT